MKRTFTLILAALVAGCPKRRGLCMPCWWRHRFPSQPPPPTRPDSPATLGHHDRWAGAGRCGHRWAGFWPALPVVSAPGPPLGTHPKGSGWNQRGPGGRGFIAVLNGGLGNLAIANGTVPAPATE